MSKLDLSLEDEMDPSIFLPYSPPSGLPQESKLATYMNHNSSTPTRALTQAMSNLSLQTSPTSIKKFSDQVLIGDFVPMNYYTPANILPESPQSSPPSAIPIMQTNTVHQENVGGTTYFYSTNSDSLNSTGINTSGLGLSSYEEDYGYYTDKIDPYSIPGVECLGAPMVAPSPYASQIYAGTPPHMGSLSTKPGLAQSFYMPETIRAEIYERNEDVFLQTDLLQYPDLPEKVDKYVQLTPIEAATPHAMASSYRVLHRDTCDLYALRRLHGHASAGSKRLDVWKQIDHPNIVRLHETYITTAFGDHSTVMIYDYHPASATIMAKYLATGSAKNAESSFMDPFSSDPDAPRPYTHQKNAMLRAVACGALLPEAVLWSMIVQLTAALRAIHSAGLACRTLDATKVVMNGCRVRIAWCGLADALQPAVNDMSHAQQEDLTALGRLALAMACRVLHVDNLAACLDLVSRTYSADLKNLILYLLTPNGGRRSVTDLMPMIGARFYTQVEALQRRADAFEEQLAHEIDNGRLLRILVKMGIINERPELNMDPAWSETGDRYMLKLFRDYLFHAVTEDGRPWIDQAHLAYSLNQLDGGTTSRVELMSRDGRSVLVVSFSELKHCLESAFDEVMQLAAAPP